MSKTETLRMRGHEVMNLLQKILLDSIHPSEKNVEKSKFSDFNCIGKCDWGEGRGFLCVFVIEILWIEKIENGCEFFWKSRHNLKIDWFWNENWKSNWLSIWFLLWEYIKLSKSIQVLVDFISSWKIDLCCHQSIENQFDYESVHLVSNQKW